MQEAGINVIGNYIFGLPDDTYASALRFGVERLNPSAPFPGPSAPFREPAPKGAPGSVADKPVGDESASEGSVAAESSSGEPVSGGSAGSAGSAGSGASAELAVKAPVEGPAKAPRAEGAPSASLKPVPSGLSGNGKAAK